MTQFNYGAAAAIFDHVCKMDDDTAEMFTRVVGFDLLSADIEANRRTLDRHTAEIIKSIREEVAPSLIQRGDGPSLAAATLVGLVSKKWNENKHRRDDDGKFTSFNVSVSRQKVKRGQSSPTRLHEGDNRGDADFDLTGGLNRTGKNTSRFAEKWHESGDDDASTNARTYRRIEAGSQLVGEYGGTKTMAAAKMGEFVGRYGPEAEKVIGPHLRRTAYRYRGTERRPDPKLAQAQRDAVIATKRNHAVTGPLSPELATVASRTAAISYLDGRLPKKKYSGLQQAAGKIPPSEGVIINADGKIITQAVGFADDHYLPFNLKNLKGLQGGSYVRSRSTGGLTTEDVYTGLVSGARSVTVVSRSGIFTVDFDDDLRGGRRYSDKARQMVSRYAKTLDAIKSEQVSRRNLTPEERATIRDEVESDMVDYGTRAEIEAEIARKTKEFKANPQLTTAELQDIELKAMTAYPDSDHRRKLARAQMIDDATEEKQASKYRLDGQGYAAALDALHEQFPYFIGEPVYIHRGTEGSEFGRSRTKESDSGYVKPGYIRPTDPQEGWYDTTITGHGKVSAAHTNYANWGSNPENRRRAGAGGRSGDASGDEQAAAGGAKPTANPKKKLVQDLAHARAQTQADESLKDLVNHYGGIADEKAYSMLTSAVANESELNAILKNPVKKKELVRQLEGAHKDMKKAVDKGERERSDYDHAETLFRTHRISQDLIGGTKLDEANWRGGESPKTPFTFDGDAYQPGTPTHVYQKEWAEVSGRGGLGSRFNDKSSDEEMRKYANFTGALSSVAAEAQATNYIDTRHITQLLAPFATNAEITRQVGRLQLPGAPAKMAFEMRKASLATERLRRIKVVAAGAESEAAPQVTPTADPKAIGAGRDDDDDGPLPRDELVMQLRDAVSGTASPHKKTFDYIANAVEQGSPENVKRGFDALDATGKSVWRDELRRHGYEV